VDLNHTGSVKSFNLGRAQTAVANTTSSFGCAGGFSAAAIDCAIAMGATITDFANNGLDSQIDQGGTCALAGGCAFGGLNPAAPAMTFMIPAGISKYNAVEMKLTFQKNNLWKWLPGVNGQISYAYSSFKNSGGAANVTAGGTPGAISNSDQDFVIPAFNNDNPNAYFGPSLLDRPQQLSFGVVGTLPWKFQVSMIAHFYSSLPLPIIVTGSGAGQIFQTDFTGDGTTGDPLPGTLNGAFGRTVQARGLNDLLQQYNSAYGNQPTPAGMVLVNNGLFTVSQLQQLGGVAPCVQGLNINSPNCTLSPAPANQQNMGSLRSFDLRLSWAYKIEAKSHVIQFQPGFGFFNLFNFANFDLPPNALTGGLNGAAGSINGTGPADRITNRVGAGTGVFNLGAPRAMEFGMRISF
jgi:hypothetical protein